MFNPYDPTPSEQRVSDAMHRIEDRRHLIARIASKAVAEFVGEMKLDGVKIDAKEIADAIEFVDQALSDLIDWPDPERDEEDRQWARADYEYERARDERDE